MNLEFTDVRSFACRGRLRKVPSDCSTVGISCIKITWQQIFKCSLHVTVAGDLLHVTVERRHLGRQIMQQDSDY